MSFILLFLIISFFAPPLSFADEVAEVWEEGRRVRQDTGSRIGEYVGKFFERARGEEDPLKAWEGYLKIHEEIPEEFLKELDATSRVVAWREMKELLEKRGDLLKNVLVMETSERELERLYEEVISDGRVTPYESFMFSWHAAPLLPTSRGGYLYEKMGDVLLEQGDVVRAYAYYQKICNYSTYRVIRKDFTERVAKKLKGLTHRYLDLLNKVEKVSALEGIRLSDGTRYRLVFEEFEIREPDLFLEISFPEEVIRRKIYDFDDFSHFYTSKKYGPLLIRDEDKILLMPQIGGIFLVFDLNGMLLEKKPITKEIASRFGIKGIHERLFSEGDFALIPKGIFKMGSPSNEAERDGDETLHTVTITKDFHLQRTEVTQFQWYFIMGEAPSYFKERKYCEEDWDEELQICPNHPVEKISWDDVQRFIQRLNEIQTEYVYRLPTEAEWEYAARLSGVGDVERRKFLTADGFLDIRESESANTKYGFGSSEDRLEEYVWYYKNSDSQTHSVLDPRIEAIGGLYNMHGNVWEWVSDWRGEYPTGAVVDPEGPLTGSYRVFRGGSWFYFPRHLRSAHRYRYSPGYRDYDLGFRVLRTMP